MGLFSWLWNILFGGNANDFKGEAGINARPNERNDAIVGGVKEAASAEKAFYIQIKKDMKLSKRALDRMDRLSDVISMDYKDIRGSFSRMQGRDAEKEAQHKAGLEIKATKDLEDYLHQYQAFLNTTANILAKEKEMIGFEDRFLKTIFLRMRDMVLAKTLVLQKKDIDYLHDGINKIITEQRVSLQRETGEDSRFSRSHKIRVGFFESFLGDAHFVNKAKKDLKKWNRQENKDLQLDQQILDALARGQLSQAMALIEIHLTRLKESTVLLEKLARDDLTALEDAMRLSDGVMQKVRSSGEIQYYIDPGLVNNLNQWHSAAARLLYNDMWNSKHFDGTLVILQRELNQIIWDLENISVRDERFNALRNIRAGQRAA